MPVTRLLHWQMNHLYDGLREAPIACGLNFLLPTEEVHIYLAASTAQVTCPGCIEALAREVERACGRWVPCPTCGGRGAYGHCSAAGCVKGYIERS